MKDQRSIVDSLAVDEVKVEAAKLTSPPLVERLGGVVEITEAELAAFGERHGGLRSAGVQIDLILRGLRFTIAHRESAPLS